MAYNVEQLKSVISSESGLARSNLYAVQLPSIPGTMWNGSVFNILTKNVTLPPRQLNTVERSINGYRSKIVNGTVTDDISMTFRVANNMAIKEYFDQWMALGWNPETRRAGYFEDYAKTIGIKVMSMPKSDMSLKLPFMDKIPDALKSLTNDLSLGPLNASLITGELSLDFGQNTTYEVTLEEAYPFTVNGVELGDEQQGFMELTVSFTYSEWYSQRGLGSKIGGLGLF